MSIVEAFALISFILLANNFILVVLFFATRANSRALLMLQADVNDAVVSIPRDARASVRLELATTLNPKREADALRAAGQEFDSARGQVRLRELGREHILGGPSIPAMWLYDRANKIDPKEQS